jgi:hypothetical protein
MRHDHTITDKLAQLWGQEADARRLRLELKGLLARTDHGSPQALAAFVGTIVQTASESGLSKRLQAQRGRAAQDIIDGVTKAPPSKVRPFSASVLYRGDHLTYDDFSQRHNGHAHYVATPGSDNTLIAFDTFEDAVVCLKTYRTIEQLAAHDDFELAPRDVIGSTPIEIFDPARVTDADRARPRCPLPASKPPSEVALFEHADFQGERLPLYPGFAFSDLTHETMHQFLFWETSSWNDSISSLITGDETVILFEHVNWSGASISFYGSKPIARTETHLCRMWDDSKALWQQIPVRYDRAYYSEVRNLTSLGWNDRASSVLHGSFF